MFEGPTACQRKRRATCCPPDSYPDIELTGARLLCEQAPQVRSLRAAVRAPLSASRNATRQVTKAEGKLSVGELKREELEGKTVRRLCAPLIPTASDVLIRKVPPGTFPPASAHPDCF